MLRCPRFVAPAILGLALALPACHREEPGKVPVPVVLVQRVQEASTATAVVYSGEVRARHEADLAFRVGGKMVARLVDVGAAVSPGMPLARLDPADLRLAAQATAAQVSAAESSHVLAKAELDRYASLLQRNFVSQAAFDAKEAAYRATMAQLRQARAQAETSGNQVEYGTLLADQPGVVTAALAEVGQVVGAGQPVFRVARSEEKEVLIHVPEGQVAALQAARSLAVNLWARPEVALRGELRELAPAADAASRTYAARIRILDADPALRLGMTAQVTLAASGLSPAIQVPLPAVVDQGQGAAVWVVAHGRVSRRPIEVDAYREDGVIIRSGLRPGETVVTVGANKLAPGMAVTPVLEPGRVQ